MSRGCALITHKDVQFVEPKGRSFVQKKWSLCHCHHSAPLVCSALIIKYLQKLLPIRLEAIRPTIIHPDQAGFLSGRQSFGYVHHLFNKWSTSKSTSSLEVIISVDAHKAFDRIEYTYLISALGKCKCGPTLISWIKSLYFKALHAFELTALVPSTLRHPTGMSFKSPYLWHSRGTLSYSPDSKPWPNLVSLFSFIHLWSQEGFKCVEDLFHDPLFVSLNDPVKEHKVPQSHCLRYPKNKNTKITFPSFPAPHPAAWTEHYRDINISTY